MMINQEARCNGKFIFSPARPGLKKSHRSFDRGVILKVDNGIVDYYSWWLQRKFGQGMKISSPAWGAHVTIVNDKDKVKDVEKLKDLQTRFNGKIIQINHEVHLKKQWQFWVLMVKPTKEMIQIRRDLNLREDFPFHITIGRDDV